MSSWSVRLTRKGRYEYGETGLPDEQMATAVYERLVEKARIDGGSVELLLDGQVVASFSHEPGGKAGG